MKIKKITAAIAALSILTSAMPAFGVYAADTVATTTSSTAVPDDKAQKNFVLDEKTGEVTIYGKFSGHELREFLVANAYEIKSIVAAEDAVLPESCINLFRSLIYCTKIDISKADASNVKNMSCMFADNYVLKEVALGDIDTSNVEDMAIMFGRCISLEKVDLSKLDTSKVGSMQGMFSDCCSLKSIEFGDIDLSSVDNVMSMFSDCYSLTELDLSSFDFSKISYVYGFLRKCSGLKKLKLGEKTGNIVSDMDLPNFDWVNEKAPTVKVSGDNSYAVIENNGENTYITTNAPEQNLCDMYYVAGNELIINGYVNKEQLESFPYKIDVKKITVSGWLPVDCSGLFSGFTSCEIIDLDDARGSLYDVSSMFKGDEELKSVIFYKYVLGEVYTSAAVNMSSMFEGCTKLENVPFDSISTANAENISRMFYGCKAIKELNLESFDTSKITEADSLFEGCDNIETIHLGEKCKGIDESMKLRNGKWENTNAPGVCVSGDGEYAVIANSGKNVYRLTKSVSSGDCNGDRDVNTADLVALSSFIIGKKVDCNISIESSDINGDGVIDIFDVTALRKLLIKKE